MKNGKVYIAMVGLPARGKSTIATRLRETFVKDRIPARIFNNGVLRRRLIPKDTSYAAFYDPRNHEGVAFRENLALISLERARRFLSRDGQVAILDATNVSSKRRETIGRLLDDHPLLFVECINNDAEILEASIRQKISRPEFKHLDSDAAVENFKQRIYYYNTIYRPLKSEKNFIRMDSLRNQVLREEIVDPIPFFDRIRDCLVSDIVRNLFLIRHGETGFNLQNRIGGNSGLTPRGRTQAQALADHFRSKHIPVIFTSGKQRTVQTAEPIQALQKNCRIISLPEFNEIDGGVCECMTYEEIRARMPQVYTDRKADKYHYVYPQGEGYVSMQTRIDAGIKKALYLSGTSASIMIIGHQAVNRMILSHFLYRRKEDVPYIYIPQDKYYHIVATHEKKLFQLKRY